MGTMGSGKTTVAQLLAKELEFPLLLEQFKTNNFLPLFYKDMKRWAFHSQTFFLLEKYQQLITIPEELKKNSIIQDTPIMQDVFSYARAQHKLGNMDKNEWDLYTKTYQVLLKHLFLPDVIIYLEASVETLMSRIALRGRKYEQTIPKSYISLLNKLNEAWVSETNIPVIRIDTNQRNIVHKNLDKEFFLISIRHALAQFSR